MVPMRMMHLSIPSLLRVSIRVLYHMSISVTFVATVNLLTVERGRMLDLDTPIRVEVGLVLREGE